MGIVRRYGWLVLGLATGLALLVARGHLERWNAERVEARRKAGVITVTAPRVDPPPASAR